MKETESQNRYRTSEKGKAAKAAYRKKVRATPYGKFLLHRQNAKRRGVEFLLTFEQWWKVWADSKRWAQRGWKPNQYVMCRREDVGPYAMGNVYIALAARNLKDAREGVVRVRHARKYKQVTFAGPTSV